MGGGGGNNKKYMAVYVAHTGYTASPLPSGASPPTWGIRPTGKVRMAGTQKAHGAQDRGRNTEGTWSTRQGQEHREYIGHKAGAGTQRAHGAQGKGRNTEGSWSTG